jgi:hypothetical protein
MGSEVTKVTGNDTSDAPVTSAVTQTSHLPQDGSIPSGPAFLESDMYKSLSKHKDRAKKWKALAMKEHRRLVIVSADLERLRKALRIASKWGIRSDGFSGEVSDSLRVWIDGGMIGEPPQIPDYYPKNNP